MTPNLTLRGATISRMRAFVAVALVVTSAMCAAQNNGAVAGSQKSVTVPASIDHNRIIIDAGIPMPGGSMQQVQVWVDNGDPELSMSRRLATALSLNVACDDKECKAPPPPSIEIGGMTIPLSGVNEVHIPLRAIGAASVMDPGIHAEMNLPSTVLRHYDVLVDFPGKKLSIGEAGTLHFRGESVKAQINAENGLIQIPSQIERKKYILALDLGSCISLLSQDIFDKLAAAHPDWPHMTGAVGSANMWGSAEETKWQVMRVDRVQYGPLFLTDVAMVDLPKATLDFFEKRAAMPTVGSLGSQALLNYRVGVDYAHSMVYFEIGRTFTFPDFDVVGLVLRPEDDGQFTISGVADADGQPSVPTGIDGIEADDRLVSVNDIPVRGSTMGQVWKLLGGTPGQERKLLVERGGKRFAVLAQVREFLAPLPDEKESKKKKK